MEKSEKQKNIDQCKRFLKPKEEKKNYKIGITTKPSTSGMHIFGLPKATIDSSSLCSQTIRHKISFLDNFQSSCFIKLSKSNITECDQLKAEISKVFVSYLISLIIAIKSYVVNNAFINEIINVFLYFTRISLFLTIR